MSQQRSILAYEHGREASQRFEYFILGVSGGLCAYIGQTLAPQRLGLSPYTLEVLSLVLLIASVIIGFKRIEKLIMCHRLNSKFLHLAEERGELVTNFSGKPLVNAETGNVRTPEQVQERIKILGDAIPKCHKQFEKTSKRANTYYKIRNWLLGLGFVGLFFSKIIAPYFS
jgi:hypothetical protein